MYRIEICDSGYEVLIMMLEEYAESTRKNIMETDDPTNEDIAVMLGCMMLVEDLKGAKHINDK